MKEYFKYLDYYCVFLSYMGFHIGYQLYMFNNSFA